MDAFGNITKNSTRKAPIAPKVLATTRIARFPYLYVKKLINSEIRAWAKKKHELNKEQSVPRPILIN